MARRKNKPTDPQDMAGIAERRHWLDDILPLGRLMGAAPIYNRRGEA